eukprot:CAMPEP_0172473720 /NCGR_PEP_ID=MMETSP1065-20121228/68996_1 /TAXON_ID=265537 /ORGANISM="Amphiprora paludosa, Strain CCMP125" /LENGTH=611 /DNA_ID=CAMNT_0013231895 /DNA_START=42 /DNA_END=1878 /DNA_ORIENTATION=+
MTSTKEAKEASAEAVPEEEEEEEDEIDEEQLDEYREMVDNLGDFPDKVKISSLSMMAEDFSDSKQGAKMIYNIIRERLMNTSTREKQLLPLIYLLDSIVKNAKGHFIPIVEGDAHVWISHAWNQLRNAEPLKLKLQKVWKTWNDGKIFDAQQLKVMGQCFDAANKNNQTQSIPSTEVAGISRTVCVNTMRLNIIEQNMVLKKSDGSLILSTGLRQEMQNILDDMQSDVTEVDKISLERLAQINPSLLAKVKQTAVEGMGSGSGGNAMKGNSNSAPKSQQKNSTNGDRGSSSSGEQSDVDSSFLADTRTPQQVERAKAWADVASKTKETDAPALVKELMGFVENCGEQQYTQADAMEMTQYMAAVSATGQLLQSTLERIQTESDQKRNALLAVASASSGLLAQTTQPQVIDPKDFTNDGIKKKVTSVISMLYEVGLPFISSTDGRRFRSQLELSKHLDSLFKKNQLEKSIAKTEERGWYSVDIVWNGETNEEDLAQADASGGDGADQSASNNNGEGGDADMGDDGYSPTTSTVPADETRDRCVICGINFKMEFDNDDGMYKYGNCREIELLNDAEIALNDSENTLVHVTCWRGLGSPKELTMDQVLQEAIHY